MQKQKPPTINIGENIIFSVVFAFNIQFLVPLSALRFTCCFVGLLAANSHSTRVFNSLCLSRSVPPSHSASLKRLSSDRFVFFMIIGSVPPHSSTAFLTSLVRSFARQCANLILFAFVFIYFDAEFHCSMFIWMDVMCTPLHATSECLSFLLYSITISLRRTFWMGARVRYSQYTLNSSPFPHTVA